MRFSCLHKRIVVVLHKQTDLIDASELLGQRVMEAA